MEKNKIKTELFIKDFTKESVYLLGYIWADGSLDNKSVRLECLSSDLESLEDVFNKTGNWNKYERHRKGRQKQTTRYICDHELYNFLVKNDFKIKSNTSPDKILDLIPHNFKHYFYLGIIDGDGCFYYNKKQRLSQFYISGTYNQSWLALENLYKILEINYNIQRVEGKKSSYSCIRVTNQGDVYKIQKYLYKNYEIDKLGLERKYLKCLEITSPRINKSAKVIKVIIKENNVILNFKSIKEAEMSLNLRKGYISDVLRIKNENKLYIFEL